MTLHTAKLGAKLDPIGKRLLETIVSVALLILVSPVLVVVALIVWRSSPGPLFYRQKRVGRDGKIFDIMKFRTMCVGADQYGPSVTSCDDSRITPVGRFLRNSKLDELPQLFNVVNGTMSLVGPRPQVPRFVDHFEPEKRDVVLSVRPGVTGLTALCFRNEERLLSNISDRETYYIERILPVKLELDAWYVQHRSLAKDLYIFSATAILLLVPPVRRRLAPHRPVREEEMAGKIMRRYLGFVAPKPANTGVVQAVHPSLWYSFNDDRFRLAGLTILPND